MEATADECIELAEALERRRALTIVATVKALGIGGADVAMPTQFHAGYQLACDEIAHRIEHEKWELSLPGECDHDAEVTCSHCPVPN
jgi:hypothetical protein